MNDVWYLLFKGESVDGMGKPDFYKRTLDKKEAINFYKGEKKNPYSTSQVFYVTDDNYHRIFGLQGFNKL